MLLAVTTKLAPYRGNYTTVLIPGIEIFEGSVGGCALQAVLFDIIVTKISPNYSYVRNFNNFEINTKTSGFIKYLLLCIGDRKIILYA